jgi:autotransporter-associated beta strand protein
MVVNRLVGEGTVVKSGADTLTLVDTTAFTGTVDVAGGTLNLAVPAAPLAPPTNTLFWVDASKVGSLDTDASGNVLMWRDATGNGRYATPVPGRYPTLRGSDFAGRPVVDMGPYGIAGSAGMYWDQRITGMKTIAWVHGEPGERRLPAGRDQRDALPPRSRRPRAEGLWWRPSATGTTCCRAHGARPADGGLHERRVRSTRPRRGFRADTRRSS